MSKSKFRLMIRLTKINLTIFLAFLNWILSKGLRTLTLRKRLRWLLVFLVFVLGGFKAFNTGILRFNYPKTSHQLVAGIDVSHHQGSIQWDLVAKDGIKFAYIKASEGGDFIDRRFQQNLVGARENGVLVGAYHFFTFCTDADAQAKVFIEQVKNIKLDLPPAVDIEFGGNCKKTPKQRTLRFELQRLNWLFQDHFKQRPVLYLTAESYDRYFKHTSIRNRVWIRNIFFRPSRPQQSHWSIWQYSNRGRVKGIGGPVDLNLLKKRDFFESILTTSNDQSGLTVN